MDDFWVLGVKGLRNTYALPDLDWLRKQFPVSFSEFIKRVVKIPDYGPNNLCLDYSLDAVFWASVLNRQTRGDVALAFGRCVYISSNSSDGKHSICAAACRIDGRVTPIAFEPQKPGVVDLLETEWGTATVEFQ